MIRQETLRAMHLSKTVNAQRVLDDVSFYIRRGEIVGIIGLENAGNRVLIDILSGVTSCDSGSIFLEGNHLRCNSIAQAQQAGIFSMSQKSQLVQDMSVAMNLFLLNTKNRNRILFSPRKIQAEAAAVLERFHLDIQPGAPVASLSPMEIRLLDLVRIAVQCPKLVILNNIPMTDDNVRDARFLHIVKRLQQDGASLLFFGNKLSNALLMSARVYLLQAGLLSSGIPRDRLDMDGAFQLLTGQSRGTPPHSGRTGPDAGSAGPELLSLWTHPVHAGGRPIFRLHAGEILGLVQDTLPYNDPEQIVSRLTQGYGRCAVYRNGSLVRWKRLKQILRSGAAIIPDLSPAGSVFSSLSCADDLSFAIQERIAKPGGWINRRKCRYTAEQSAAFLGIHVQDLDQALGRGELSAELSKKIQIGRWLWRRPDIYIFFNPFSALDEKGYEEIKRIMQKLALRNVGLLILSSDYNKLYDICTRVIDRQPDDPLLP